MQCAMIRVALREVILLLARDLEQVLVERLVVLLRFDQLHVACGCGGRFEIDDVVIGVYAQDIDRFNIGI